jgi:hypothetical protein
MSEFFQDGPVLANQFEEDRLLRSYLEWGWAAQRWCARDLVPVADPAQPRLFALRG